MAWQTTFSRIFGPGLFAGVTVRDWLRLLRENCFAIHPRYALRFLSITASSLGNSLCGRLDEWRYGGQYRTEQIPPPVFVLGHWRSGTTHLHGLLSKDDRFAYPNIYQVLYPHSFLTTEAINTRLLAFLMPRTRFGIDNLAMSWDTPYEDEFALASMTCLTPYMTMAFPDQKSLYDRYLTLNEATPAEVDQWQAALTLFLQKLTFKFRRPLIIKSPGHTCRIKLLLSLFPDAKFVHIRRHPFRVYQSMQQMVSKAGDFWRLRNDVGIDWDERIINQYREMYDAYFAERQLIPGGNLCELSFEELESDRVAETRRIYESLNLPDFDVFEPRLRKYVDSLHGYRKNSYYSLPNETRDRLAREWRTCFETWDYST